jgi:hypothetical protein
VKFDIYLAGATKGKVTRSREPAPEEPATLWISALALSLYGLCGPFPNTDPGLAGETGTSGATGAV